MALLLGLRVNLITRSKADPYTLIGLCMLGIILLAYYLWHSITSGASFEDMTHLVIAASIIVACILWLALSHIRLIDKNRLFEELASSIKISGDKIIVPTRSNAAVGELVASCYQLGRTIYSILEFKNEYALGGNEVNPWRYAKPYLYASYIFKHGRGELHTSTTRE